MSYEYKTTLWGVDALLTVDRDGNLECLEIGGEALDWEGIYMKDHKGMFKTLEQYLEPHIEDAMSVYGTPEELDKEGRGDWEYDNAREG